MGILAAFFFVIGILNAVGIVASAMVNPERLPLRIVLTILFLGLGFVCHASASKQRRAKQARLREHPDTRRRRRQMASTRTDAASV